jgi:hypothetical protein
MFSIEKRDFEIEGRVCTDFYHGECHYKYETFRKKMWCLVEKESGNVVLWSEERENIAPFLYLYECWKMKGE